MEYPRPTPVSILRDPRRPATGASASTERKRRRRDRDELDRLAVGDDDDAETEAGALFNDDDDRSGEGGDDGEPGPAPRVETPAEQRLRVARSLLAQARRDRGSGSDDDGSDEEAVAERLRRAADLSSGAAVLRLATRAGEASTSGSRADGAAAPQRTRLYKNALKGASTAVCLGPRSREAFFVSKAGGASNRGGPVAVDVTTGKTRRLGPLDASLVSDAKKRGGGANTGAAYWVAPPQRRGGARDGLLAVAASDDGRSVAAGGGDGLVHLWDARTGRHSATLGGHRDAVTGLSFRPTGGGGGSGGGGGGQGTLLSSSADRSVRVWDVGARALADQLFGHQQECLCVDACPRGDRAVTGGADRTCRMWKIPEETQLVFRARGMTVEAATWVSGSQWVAGGQDGGVSLYTSTQKKPIWTARGAHRGRDGGNYLENDADGGGDRVDDPDPALRAAEEAAARWGAACCRADAAPAVGGGCGEWVSALAHCRGTDLAASGAGDGIIRLWRLEGEPGRGGYKRMEPVGRLSAPGFVNGLALGLLDDAVDNDDQGGQAAGRAEPSAVVVAAALSREPRLGRWEMAPGAREGLLISRLDVAGGGRGDDGDGEE